MHALRQQRTISRPVAVEGFGYWSAQDVRLEFRPAAACTGIVFVRGDLTPRVRIPALAARRVDCPRRTTLRAHGASVEMVEHVLAALWGLRIDNCEVWTTAAEMPGCDGSSLPFVEALHEAGIVEQRAARPCLRVARRMRLGDERHWIEVAPAESGELAVRYELDYGSGNPIGRQVVELEITPETFRRELAASRTFLLRDEAEWLRSQGLGQRTTPQDLLVFDEQGPVGNALRFPDECARHKVLDLVGDFALAGCDLAARITAYRSGHRLNAEMVRALTATAGAACGLRRCA
jgi:UDP-3-O-[3-hydroxymyristoyl] N-acetylglucosamine deacetylase